MTGERGSAVALMDVAQQALETMEVLDAKNFIATTTDNPAVMRAFREKFQLKYFWVLVSHIYLNISKK